MSLSSLIYNNSATGNLLINHVIFDRRHDNFYMLMIIGSDMVFCKNTGSTNTYASGLIKSGHVSEGTVIYTNFQSAGRGQKGNRWESEDGKESVIQCYFVSLNGQPG